MNTCITFLLLLIILLVSFNVYTQGLDLQSDKAALVSIRDSVKGRLRFWNISDLTPCNWSGVVCNQNQSRVMELRLPGMGLVGQLPSGIGNLTNLTTLSLRFNALSGSIPPEFVNLAVLRNLFLQENSFSGEIPGFLYGMQSLVRLNLAGNNFSGEISERINNLTKLDTLFLEKNGFSGLIPDINITGLTNFNVSFNRLNGSVPERFSGFSMSSFEGNSLCGKPLQACPGGSKSNKLSGGAIAGIVIGSFLVFVLIMVVLIVACQKRNGNGKSGSKDLAVGKRGGEIENPRENVVVVEESGSRSMSKSVSARNKSLVFFGNVAKTFDLEDLLKASAEVLGKGTFGTAYKATLESGMTVVVKRLKDVTVSEKEFRERIEEIGRMVHVNLVTLKGYYYNRDEKLLVYDFMPLGSLSALLHGNKGSGRTPLNWETRSGIALGTARAIAFIHSQGPTISHGNIKSSNILLTITYEARVSDFGLAHLALPTSTPNRIDGYRAPEVTDAQKVSQKADVYSFGILLLEMLTGKPPTHALLNEEGVDLPRWVQSVVREEWTSEVFDMELLRYQNVEEEMVQLLQIALQCTAQYLDKRPSMAEVTNQIEDLCNSSSQQVQEDSTPELFYEEDEGLSQQFYSFNSVAQGSSV